MKVCKEIARQHRAAVTIQTAYRGYSQKRHYSTLQRSSRVIQCYWRATLLARHCQTEYLEYKRAIIVLQSHVRKRMVQRYIAYQHNAATVIQASFRRYRQQKIYLRLKHSANTIVHHWRATVLAREQRNCYLAMKQSAITIQSHYRRWKVQRRMAYEQRAAIVIQATVKQWIQRRRYSTLTHSVRVIQRYWLATVAARRCRRLYLQQRNAIIVLQAHARRRAVQRVMAHQHYCATVIQSIYRGYSQRQRYLSIKESVRVIQCHLQATLLARRCRSEYLALRQATIICQSHLRRRQVQRMITDWHTSACTIQTLYRCYIQRKRYEKLLSCIRLIQVHWRAVLLGRKCRLSYLQQMRAIILIQALARRRQVRVMLAQQHRAATTIQTAYRKYSARKRFLITREKASVIALYWRATLLSRKCRARYLNERRAVIVLQSHVRRMRVQRMIASQHSAAIKIQSAYRCYKQRVEYLSMKRSVSVISRYWRVTLIARQDRAAFFLMKKAAVTIQSHFRRKKVMEMIHSQHRAAITIQARYRCYAQRRAYLKLLQSVLVIQCYWRAALAGAECRAAFIKQKRAAIVLQAHTRRMLVQKQLRAQHRAATLIQSVYRGYTMRNHYLRMKKNVCTIQYYWRARLLSRDTRTKYIVTRNATITIQAHFRKWQVQQTLAKLHHAATRIQAVYRGYTQRRQYLLTIQSTLVLQRYWRSRLLTKRCRHEYLQLRRAVVMVQSHFRRRLVQRQLSHQHTCATRIQAAFRCHQQRTRYLSLKHGTVLVQRWWKNVLLSRQCRLEYLKKKGAIIVLQCHVRRWLVQQTIASMNRSATVIQSVVRGFVCRKKYARLKKIMEERTYAAIAIQRYWRQYQEAHYYERKRNRCATKIQSLWRGYCVRRDSKSKAVARARRRIHAANQAAEERDKLMNRLPSMLDTLLQTRYLSTVGDILKSLELMTSVSEKCSVVIVEGNALDVLYRFMEGSNRSRPTLEVAKICLQILNNVSKWSATRSAVFPSTDAVVCLVDFMQKVYVTHLDIMLPATILLHTYRKLHPLETFPNTLYRKLTLMLSALNKKKSSGHHHHKLTNQQHQLTVLCVQYLKEITVT